MDSSGNKNLPPTRKKLKKAREDGDVAKSQGITASCAIIGVALGVFIGFNRAFLELLSIYPHVLTHIKMGNLNNTLTVGMIFMKLTLEALMLPLCLSAFFSLLAEIMQVGVVWSFKNLSPNISRISFSKGFNRLFGNDDSGGVMRSLRQCQLALVINVGALGVLLYFLSKLGVSLFLAGSYLEGVVEGGVRFIFQVVFYALMVVVSVAIIDYFFERHKRYKRLQMNIHELKKELKESEGDLEQKMFRRHLHQEILAKASVDGVRRAKVLVVGTKLEK